MSGHRKDKKPAPSGSAWPCSIRVLAALAALLLVPRYLHTVADLHQEVARLARPRPPLWRRALTRITRRARGRSPLST